MKIYSTPHDFIEDIVIVPEVDLQTKKAEVRVSVETVGSFDEVRVTILDEEGQKVGQASGTNVTLKLSEFNYGNH